MKKIYFCYTGFLFTVAALAIYGCNSKPAENKNAALSKTDLRLTGGFSATIVADSIGPVRHLALNKDGEIFVKLNALKDGKGIYLLSDTDHDGRMEKKTG